MSCCSVRCPLISPLCVFRCVRCKQLAVCGGRRRWQLQFGLCGVLQSELGQVDATADLHEHGAQLCRCVGSTGTCMPDTYLTFCIQTEVRKKVKLKFGPQNHNDVNGNRSFCLHVNGFVCCNANNSGTYSLYCTEL